MERDRLVTLFRRWSDIEAVSNLSPLYALLGHAVADSDDLLELANERLPGQPPPNILFATVHAYLAGRPAEPLAAYYATLGGMRAPDADAPRLFQELCRRERDALLPVIRNRLTQTNEVRRSALLLPAFAEVTALSGQPLALFEIGPSAGLNLNFDRYHYRYGGFATGDLTSPLTLECEPRGDVPRVQVPAVASRLGIDINPLYVTNPDDVAWLRALLWPEHTDRLALLNAALAIAAAHPPPLLAGDVFEVLPPHIAETPAGHAVCVFATFVLIQFTPEMRLRLRELLLELSRARPIWMVLIGSPGFVEPGSQLAGEEQVWLLRIENGHGQYRPIATANPHGRWIDNHPNSAWKPWLESV